MTFIDKKKQKTNRSAVSHTFRCHRTRCLFTCFVHLLQRTLCLPLRVVTVVVVLRPAGAVAVLAVMSVVDLPVAAVVAGSDDRQDRRDDQREELSKAS